VFSCCIYIDLKYGVTSSGDVKTRFFHNQPLVNQFLHWLSKGVIIWRHAGLYAGSKNTSRVLNSGDSTSDTDNMLATRISLIRTVICSWRLLEHGRCGLIPMEPSVRCCRRSDKLMALGCTTRTWAISPFVHPPTCANRPAKGAVAGGDNEWLTAGDVTTCHKQRGVMGDLWWHVLLKLRRLQHAT